MEKFLKLLHYLKKYERQELIYQKSFIFYLPDVQYCDFATCTTGDDLDDEVTAYKKGDYKTGA